VCWRVNALRLPALDLFSGNVDHVEESTCRRRGLFGRLQAFEALRPAGPGDLTPKSALLFHGRPGAGDQASPRYTGTLISQ
jgi:hypothetical protein